MNTTMIKIAVGCVLVGGAMLGVLVTLAQHGAIGQPQDPAAVVTTGGSPGGAGPGGTSPSAASMVLDNKRIQLVGAQQQLANAQTKLMSAREQVAIATNAVQSLQLQINQQAQQVRYAEMQLAQSQRVAEQNQRYEAGVAGHMAALGVDMPSNTQSDSNRVINDMRAVQKAKFDAQMQIQQLQMQQQSADGQRQNAARAAETATRDVTVAQGEVERLDREIRLAMTPGMSP